MNINKIEKVLDETNADYGSKEEYCIYCKSKEYNSKVGIVHEQDCIIQELRDEIKNKRKKCKWLHADWCCDPKDEWQEKCPFYSENYLCPSFNEKK